MNLVDFIAAIPEGIWGVLVGSLLAFGGTYVATRRQLKHDAEQRERERIMQLRREVFLEAAEGAGGSADHFMRFANVELPLSELGTSPSKSGSINKLYTVASLPTIEAFAQAGATLGAASFDLVRQRLVAEDIKNKISGIEQQTDAMRSVQERIREAASAATAEPQTPEVVDRLALMQTHWDETWRALETLGNERSRLLDEKIRVQRTLLEQAVQYSIDYQRKLRKALVALRLELELPLEGEQFEAVMSRIDAEMLPKFKQLLDAIDSDASNASAQIAPSEVDKKN